MAAIGASILGCAGPRLSADERAFFADAQPWGFILFARNVESKAQLRALTSELRESVGRDAPILIDQEGGRVQRMGPPLWREWLPALDQMALAGAQAMRLRYRLIAAELREVGIDVNCAPVCDIADRDTHRILKNRCYGTDPDAVVAAARAVVAGLADGGVAAVMKHMPGHGRARVDSHKALPVVHDDVEALHDWDFAPFRALNDLPMAMTAHIVFTALDPERPATTSPVLQRVIREEIGFAGLLMTDDISMEALQGSLAQRARAAVFAGCDIVLHCTGDLAEMQEIAGACGLLDRTSQARAAAALNALPKGGAIDIAETEAKLKALLGGRADG